MYINYNRQILLLLHLHLLACSGIIEVEMMSLDICGHLHERNQDSLSCILSINCKISMFVVLHRNFVNTLL